MSARRWIFHLRVVGNHGDGDYAPSSLASEGFVHGSFRPDVASSARLYFPKDANLEVLQIDPRRTGPSVRLEVVDTPRGPMPHLHGAIARDAVRKVYAFDAFAEGVLDGTVPDEI